MTKNLISRNAAAIIAIGLMLAAPQARAEVNQSLRNLRPLLLPAKATDKVTPGDLKKTSERLVKILEYLYHSQITQGPPASDLISNTYKLYLQNQVGPKRALMTSGAILEAFDAARTMGLFEKLDVDKYRFQTTVTKGRARGEMCIFEYIVPPKKAPLFSNSLMNVRLTAPGLSPPAREGGKLTLDQERYVKELASLEKEVKEGRPVDLGRTRVEALALWQKEVDEAGEELFNKAPYINISGNITATPSSLTDYRWRVTLDVTNISQPTEVTLEHIIYGISEKENVVYVMARGSRVLKLRRNENRHVDVWTRHENEYRAFSHALDLRAGYDPEKDRDLKGKGGKKKKKKGPNVEIRAWTAVIKHKGETIEWDASQRPLIRYVEEAASMPAYKPGGKKK